MNEIQEELNNGEIVHAHGCENPILTRCQFFQNMVNRFNTIPIKISPSYFVDIDKLIL